SSNSGWEEKNRCPSPSERSWRTRFRRQPAKRGHLSQSHSDSAACRGEISSSSDSSSPTGTRAVLLILVTIASLSAAPLRVLNESAHREMRLGLLSHASRSRPRLEPTQETGRLPTVRLKDRCRRNQFET